MFEESDFKNFRILLYYWGPCKSRMEINPDLNRKHRAVIPVRRKIKEASPVITLAFSLDVSSNRGAGRGIPSTACWSCWTEETDYSLREAEATESCVGEFWKGGSDKELPRNLLRVPLNLCWPHTWLGSHWGRLGKEWPGRCELTVPRAGRCLSSYQPEWKAHGAYREHPVLIEEEATSLPWG